MNSRGTDKLENSTSKQYQATGVEADQYRAGDDKNRQVISGEIELKPETANLQSSNLGQRTMHEHQSLDQSVREHVEQAVEWFYFFAYHWFGMKHNLKRRRGQITEPGCRPPYSEGICASETLLSRQDIVFHFTSELSDGIETDKSAMESWAYSVLDSRKFDHLCPSCDGLFKSTELFDSHLIKLKTGQVRCPYSCGKHLVTCRNVRTHLKIVHRCKRKDGQDCQVKCEYKGCERSFPTSSRLRMHAIRKHNLKTRMCLICKKDFQTKEIMIAHQLTAHGVIHGEPRQFECEVDACGKRFATRRGRDLHRSLTHKKYTSKKGYFDRCTEKGCGKLFKTIEGLIKHIEENHWQ